MVHIDLPPMVASEALNVISICTFIGGPSAKGGPRARGRALEHHRLAHEIDARLRFPLLVTQKNSDFRPGDSETESAPGHAPGGLSWWPLSCEKAGRGGVSLLAGSMLPRFR